MEKYLLLLFLSCCGAFTICGAQTVTVRGRVIDRKTGEVLSDANVADLVLGTGVATNSYGLYSIHVKSKQCILRCSMLGYATKIDTLTLAVNMVHDFALMPDNYQLNDVEIVGERKFGGQLALTQKEIQSFPTLGSEPDVLKSLQYLPGVISGNEGTNNISVRGSDQWGNLVLLDEAMVYNPNHALSFFSVFNNDAIQQVNLYKSYFPLMYGGRTSLLVGFLSTLISCAIGVPLGLVAGYARGKAEAIIMRIADIFMSFPSIVLILVLVAVLGPSVWSVTCVIGVLGWTQFARLIYANVLSVSEKDYVESARAIGTSNFKIVTKYVLPNSFAPILIAITFQMASAILSESSLSFLGMGVQPPGASWGNMLYDAQSITVLSQKLWIWFPPGLALLVTVLSINFLGDGIRDALDPKIKL